MIRKAVDRIFRGRFLSIRSQFLASMVGTILLFGAINFLISHAVVDSVVGEHLTSVGLGNAAAEAVRKMDLAMTGMTLLFLLLGIAGAAAFSRILSEPIRDILRGFESFVPGDPMPEIRTRLNDETRLLAQGFRSMMERINEIDRHSRSTQARIVETERLASMGTMATGLAHEINNPIAGIEMCVRRLQKSDGLDAKQAEYLGLIAEATSHIKGVVGDLLRYAHKPENEKVPLDLRDVIADAAKLSQPRLKRNGIRLHLDLPPSSCRLLGVKSHLVQVVMNGILNSMDAIGYAGHIRITLRGGSSGHRIEIEDDGSGLTAEAATRAFEPFFTTKGRKGTGLGLYVSFGMIQAHHGSMELREGPGGRGACLVITLPGGEGA